MRDGLPTLSSRNFWNDRIMPTVSPYPQWQFPDQSERELGENDALRHRTRPSRAPLYVVPRSDAAEPLTESRNSTDIPGDQTDSPSQGMRYDAPIAVVGTIEHTYETVVLQQWEGTVVEISEERIVARLTDISATDHPEEQASFELDEIPDADHDLVLPGAVFYWSIAYRRERTGQKLLTSAIRFRRLPAWSRRDVERVRQEASRFDAIFSD